MDSQGIIKAVRVRLDEVLDLVDTELEDEFILEYMEDSLNVLMATEIVTESYDMVDAIITPEPSLIDGLLVATHTVRTLLVSDIAKKVRDGSLGIRFRTGQDEISTVEASKQLSAVAEDISREFRRLVIAKLSKDPNNAHRLQ